MKSTADLAREKKEEAERQARLKKEKAERQARLKAQKVKEDACFLELQSGDEGWSDDNARFLCRLVLDKPNIYANCLIHKGRYKSLAVIQAADTVCRDIAENPSAIDKILYSTSALKWLP